jgi:hypothetical protein
MVAQDLRTESSLMQDFDLSQLDQRTIAVELCIASRKRLLKGIGQYDSYGALGPSLRIGIQDAAGDFDIVLKQNEWNGRIRTGEQFRCDFALQLDAACLCTH